MPQLRLAILWHMHQPFYLDPVEGRFALPWTRLHSLKDYLDMPLAAIRPGQRVNFNLVPSLVQQWIAWRDGTRDRVEELCDRPPSALSSDERAELTEWLFRAHRETMIDAFPEYRELHRRQLADPNGGFDDAELTRLKFWFHLAWLDPSFRSESLPARLAAAPESMTEQAWPEFKAYLDGFASRLLECYPRLHEQGDIELSMSPFYHPILPLLIDSDCARSGQPGATLPDTFRHPEDARWQLRESRRFARDTMGCEIDGLWPSEGSLSEPMLAMAAAEGYRWAASDEELLARSLGMSDLQLPMPRRSELLYRPYRFGMGENAIDLVFRDHFLSDRIGFSYASWDAEAAVDDFLHHLDRIRLGSRGREPLVSVILDGENCWEHYVGDGGLFLSILYEKLAETPWLNLDGIGRHLKAVESAPLDRVQAGSWIGANFSIWIGHSEDNRSWDALSRVREDLVAKTGGGPPEAVGEPDSPSGRAWRCLFAAEGSDWNWWYGDDHGSEDDLLFDRLYRAHLAGVYEALGEHVPEWLSERIARGKSRRDFLTPLGISKIRMDGKESSYFEWRNAACWRPGAEGGAMTRTDLLLEQLWLAFGEQALHLRLDLASGHPAVGELERVSLDIALPEPVRFRFVMHEGRQAAEAETRGGDTGRWSPRESAATSVKGKIMELRIPWSELPGRPGQVIQFTLTLLSKAGILEILPSASPLQFMRPDKDYDRVMWKV
jgi:alpha-amylase/alpha-mannosidase (GH57 family)